MRNRQKLFRLLEVVDRKTQRILFDDVNQALSGFGSILHPSSLPLSDSVTIEFITPLRLKSRGKYIYKPSFQDIVRAILRRSSLLVRGYCDEELKLPYKSLIEQASKVELAYAGTDRVEIERYSTRQRTKIPLIGFRGLLRYEGKISKFSEILDAGAHIHIGGATAFGFGRLKII